MDTDPTVVQFEMAQSIYRLTRRTGCEAVIEKSRNPTLRNIFRAHALYMMSPVSYEKVTELLLPLHKTDSLAPCDYNILISSLIGAGYIEEGKRVLERLIILSRSHKSYRIHSEVALLSIALDNAEAAIEFSGRSGGAWLQQYVGALYGTSERSSHDSLSDRPTKRSASSNAINLAILDYKSPLNTL